MKEPSAKPDLPFTPVQISYMAEGLRIAGIEPDRPWLVSTEPLSGNRDWNIAVSLGRQDAYAALPYARQRVPKTRALWELAPFFEASLPPAAYDMANGPLDNFPIFRFLYLRLMGEASADWLPSLYLAAAAIPNIDTVHRAKLIDAFIPDFLERRF